MKRIILVASLLLGCACCLLAQTVPQTVRFQGRLAKTDGTPVPDTTIQTLTFRLYDSLTGGSKLWEQTFSSSVIVHNGTFAVLLDFAHNYVGSSSYATVFSASDPDHTPYLEIQFDSAPITPRQALTSVAYAFLASEALTVPDGSITSDKLANGAVTAAKLAPDALSDVSGIADVANYGAVGDGVTDDTNALNRAIASGKHVRFGANRIYLISGELALHPGQILYGNNATLRRCNQFTTTTTTPITAGVTTQVTLPDASRFRPGMNVAFWQGSQSSLVIQQTLSPNAIVTAVNGNTLTFSTANCSFTGVTNVSLAFFSLVTADDCRVYDLNFDGNRANWNLFSRWEVVVEIGDIGSRTLLQGVKITDAAGEGIVVGGGRNQTIRDCTLTNLAGNGIHFSGVGGNFLGGSGGGAGPTVDSCRVINANLGNAQGDIGHQDGCIVWSNGVVDVNVTNCYCENGVAGIGSIDSADNSHCTIIGNTVRNCTQFGIEGYNGSGDNIASTVIIKGNRIYSSGLADPSTAGAGIIVYSAGMATPARDWMIEGNYLENCGILVATNSGLPGVTPPALNSIRNNHLKQAGIVVSSGNLLLVQGNTIDRSGDSAHDCLTISGLCAGSRFDNNLFLGGRNGFNSGGNLLTDVAVSANHCMGQFSAGVLIGAAGNCPNLLIAGNVCDIGSGSASWAGVSVSCNQAMIVNNACTGPQGNAGIVLNGNYNCAKGNTCRATGGGARSIWILSGTGNIVADNLVTVPPTDSGTATVLRNNDITQ
jgi:hypothetical protein